MEKQPDISNKVRITKAVFDGLEFIRQSGVTNMLDRPMVISLAREWDFEETADWIESVDTRTYGQLIFQGPDVLDEESTIHIGEDDEMNEDDALDPSDAAVDRVRDDMHNLIATLGKRAILTIADTYETERMGVLIDRSRRDVITAEQHALIRNLGHASSLWIELEQSMIEVQRGIGSLQYLIDPENT